MNHFHVLWSMTAILAFVVSSSLGEMASYRSTSSLEDAAEVYARVADADELRILSSARMRRSIITEARKSFVRWVRQTQFSYTPLILSVVPSHSTHYRYVKKVE